MKTERIRLLKKGVQSNGPVVYWMSRDQRATDNWALLYAQRLAIERKQPLLVLFCLVPSFLNAPLRHYDFMLNGMREVAVSLKHKHISFFVCHGEPGEEIPRFLKNHKAGILVTDFDPLTIKRRWKEEVSSKIVVPFYEVDAHNCVPCWIASDKQEFAAYTIRPKIHKLLPAFLNDFTKVTEHPFLFSGDDDQGYSVDRVINELCCDKKVKPVSWAAPGGQAGLRVMRNFIKQKLVSYDTQRNDPNSDSTSNVSAYLHFGQISAQRLAMEVQRSTLSRQVKEAFLEEVIVRRELADNFCFYNKNYDNFKGFPDWAKKTLNGHREDKRPYSYSVEEFEQATTHDALWNAAQMEMVNRGKMHGYMRMYWCKKILEWTCCPEDAQRIAIYLNDKYELDGRDPNGYVGVAWSIGGVHDRAWGERPIFGKIRFMSYNGCKSKFRIDEYIQKVKNNAH